jgi:S-adenosylmethionine:tRNA ribosyltransferase-isomerase
LKTELFDFHLPEELIAHQPLRNRDGARLLCVNDSGLNDKHIADLLDILTPNDVLVFNDSRVIPARLYGKRSDLTVEVLLHQQINDELWRAFARPTKRLKIGQSIVFADDFTGEIIEKLPSGEIVLQFQADDFWLALEQYGSMPLPPYIKREVRSEDLERYQTVYAKDKGSVAAPTAGLHFTDELLAKLKERGVEQYFVTLHVGGGTFLPVKVEDTTNHIMHSETGIITKETAQRLNQAKKMKKNIIAVGTTSLRILESATDSNGVLQPFNGSTDIFITPSYNFKLIDKLITNFHLPKSTLFMLVCALSGTEHMLAAYQYAIQQKYRFYSYGDACLLEKSNDL